MMSTKRERDNGDESGNRSGSNKSRKVDIDLTDEEADNIGATSNNSQSRSAGGGIRIFVPLITTVDVDGIAETHSMGTFSSDGAAMRALVRWIMENEYVDVDALWDYHRTQERKTAAREDAAADDSDDREDGQEFAADRNTEEYIPWNEALDNEDEDEDDEDYVPPDDNSENDEDDDDGIDGAERHAFLENEAEKTAMAFYATAKEVAKEALNEHSDIADIVHHATESLAHQFLDSSELDVILCQIKCHELDNTVDETDGVILM
jgi:hypothetical protein